MNFAREAVIVDMTHLKVGGALVEMRASAPRVRQSGRAKNINREASLVSRKKRTEDERAERTRRTSRSTSE